MKLWESRRISKADFELVSDTFQIHELIGQSQRSLIYRATSLRGFLRGRQVALKVVSLKVSKAFHDT
jgi:hypothetical protein